MFSLPTLRRPRTASFHTAVYTRLPFHSMSRGRPTFTESSCAISIPIAGHCLCVGFQGTMPLPPKRIAPAVAPRRTPLLILFTDSLGVGFAVRIEQILAALLPRRLEFGRCDVPVRPAFLGNSA